MCMHVYIKENVQKYGHHQAIQAKEEIMELFFSLLIDQEALACFS